MNYQSTIFSQYLGSHEMQLLVNDSSFIKNMILFQKALATCQAALQIIPQSAATEIETVLETIHIEPKELAAGTLQNGVPVITFLGIIRKHLSEDCKKYLHFGATSQDVMDTAQVLIIKDAAAIIQQNASTLITQLQHLKTTYHNQPCMAHTRGQQAMPTTFGFKVNAWLQPLIRLQEQLSILLPSILKIQLGGAVGNNIVYGNKATALIQAMATSLNITAAQPWHNQRDGFCNFTNYLAMLTGILSKMGTDILVLSQTEINEVLENAAGGGKSSSMPHKNNPILSEALVVIATINNGLHMQQMQALIHANERDATAWILEWNALPQLLINTNTALTHANTIAKNIQINSSVMQQNVDNFLSKSNGD